MSTTHYNTHLTVFIPFIREYLSVGDLSNILHHVGVVEHGTVRVKRPPGRDAHFYAYLNLRPHESTKQGRELLKNLRANLTTFISLNSGESYLELKPYLTREMRIERGFFIPYSEPPTASVDYEHQDDYDQFVQVDDAQDFDHLMREVDQVREEVYSLWKPTCYPVLNCACLS